MSSCITLSHEIDVVLFLYRRDQKYNHCRIHTKAEGGRTKYYLIENVCFDSIFDLIEHYRVSGRYTASIYIIIKPCTL